MPAGQTPSRTISAADLFQAYVRNDRVVISLHQTSLIITGTVESADLDEAGFIVLKLKSVDNKHVIAEAQMAHESWEKASSLDANSKVSMHCINPYWGGSYVALRGCRFI